MDRAGWRRIGLAAVALVLVALACPAWAAPAPEDDSVKKQALALNDVTGEDAIKGQIRALVKDSAGTKKLLAKAAAMAKEKDQPFGYNALYILARAGQELKDYDAAETFYKLASQQALKLQSGSKVAQTYGGLIDLLFEAKKYAECEKLCKEFLDIGGDDNIDKLKFAVFRRIIQVQAKQEKFDDANKLVDGLLKNAPDNWVALELKGWVQKEAGEFEEAVKTYEDVLDKINKDKKLKDDEKDELAADVRYILSNVYLEMKNIDKVTEQLQTLLKKDPANPTYNNDLGYIWADHDRNLDEAEKMIRKAIEEDRKQQKKKDPDLKDSDLKDNGAYLDSLGWVLFKKKKFKEAKEELEKAILDKEGQHTEIYDHLADACMALGEKKEAVEAWKKAVEVAGDTKREQQRKAEIEKKIKANQ